MNHHYVFAPHDPDLAERAIALVADHRAGHGIRAVTTATEPGEFGHVIAMQADDEAALHKLLDGLGLPVQALAADTSRSGTAPLTLSVCGDVPCEKLTAKFAIVPNGLPLCDHIVFVLLELDKDIHEIVSHFDVPHVGSHLAGVAIADGRSLLIELANDDPAELKRDLAQIRALAHVRSVRTVHAAGRDVVRSPHL